MGAGAFDEVAGQTFEFIASELILETKVSDQEGQRDLGGCFG